MACSNGELSYYGVILLLSYISLMILSIFSCICWPPDYLHWIKIYSNNLPTFKLGCNFLLSCKTLVYILGTNPLSERWFANLSLSSYGLSFHNIYIWPSSFYMALRYKKYYLASALLRCWLVLFFAFPT